MQTEVSFIGIVLAVLGAFLAGALLVAASMFVGYWAGRNSSERPFRSESNPRAPRPEAKKEAIPEPEGGDFYQDAAFGDEKGPVPTMMKQ